MDARYFAKGVSLSVGGDIDIEPTPNKGLNVLFSGLSGTGKTMAAEIIANELKLDLYAST